MQHKMAPHRDADDNRRMVVPQHRFCQPDPVPYSSMNELLRGSAPFLNREASRVYFRQQT
jgi:hypothetical protein